MKNKPYFVKIFSKDKCLMENLPFSWLGAILLSEFVGKISSLGGSKLALDPMGTSFQTE